MAVTDILMDLFVAVVAVIIGAYILNLMGYLTHKSPVNMFSGDAPTTQFMKEAGTGGSSQGIYDTGQTAVPPGSITGGDEGFGRSGVV